MVKVWRLLTINKLSKGVDEFLNSDFLPNLTFKGDSEMSVINSNSAAMVTANSLNKNERAMNGIMERLSTGKRINSAADDAAGLAIATKMTAQVRGLDQAARNANNATSMLQLADGSAEQISNILQRMREITVQASDGSNSQADIDIINVEFKQAAAEIDRIVDATQFNGKNLLDGTAGGSAGGTVSFQIGANTAQTLDVNFGDFNLAAGGTEQSVASTYTDGIGTAPGTNVYDTTANGGITFNTGDVVKVGEYSYTIQAGDTAAQIATGLNTAAGSDYGVANNAGVITFTAPNNDSGVENLGAMTFVGGPMGENVSGFATNGMLTALNAGTSFAHTLDALDTAITGVATQRAVFGASMNRLTSVIDNLAAASEATATARGRIEDANYASETTALARSQIISQAGTAMLAQANQKAQSVLSLLQ